MFGWFVAGGGDRPLARRDWLTATGLLCRQMDFDFALGVARDGESHSTALPGNS